MAWAVQPADSSGAGRNPDVQFLAKSGYFFFFLFQICRARTWVLRDWKGEWRTEERGNSIFLFRHSPTPHSSSKCPQQWFLKVHFTYLEQKAEMKAMSTIRENKQRRERVISSWYKPYILFIEETAQRNTGYSYRRQLHPLSSRWFWSTQKCTSGTQHHLYSASRSKCSARGAFKQSEWLPRHKLHGYPK